MNEDERFMRIALTLAEKGNPSPNPYVGAVIVKERRILATGYHKKAGMPHAEIEALKNLRSPKDVKGATMYVNLEPCNHFGKTPPCTKAIIKSGIAKVVFAMKDPNPNVAGDGESELLKHGIKVKKGILENEAQKLNEIFIKYSKTKIPFVVLKAAMSIDGKIATRTGDSKWITGKKARVYGREMRAKYDAILIGINTVLKDNPTLTSRIKNANDPIRIILDDRLRVPFNANVLKDSNAIIATSEKYKREKSEKIKRKGVKIIIAGKRKVDLKKLLKKLGSLGITSVLVEGGSEVGGAFTDAKLVDKFIFFLAPKIIGGRDAKPAIGGNGIDKLTFAINLRIANVIKIGKDFFFECYPTYSRT